MDRTERLYRIERMLRSRKVVTMDTLLRELEVSRATVKRDLEYLRSRLNAPIEWDAFIGGYHLASQATGPIGSELPGLWFGPSEAHALLTMHHLLEQIGGGLLQEHVEPIRQRLERMLGSRGHGASEVRSRIRLLQIASRRHDASQFATLAEGLLERRQLRIVHHNRSSGEHLERLVSPQRLVYYRDNWYLDAWCHLREGLRSFAVDAVERSQLIDLPARHVADDDLDRYLSSGYGIFSGSDVSWARLKFTAERARWVSREQWHPEQRAHQEAGGSYVLELPYSDPRELVMDILRHGPEVEVLEPPALRQTVADLLRKALEAYVTPAPP